MYAPEEVLMSDKEPLYGQIREPQMNDKKFPKPIKQNPGVLQQPGELWP
jgi:hypothetical protein